MDKGGEIQKTERQIRRLPLEQNNQNNRDVEYSVAKEKCEAMAGAAKDSCMADVKVLYKK
jgi:hypothetical protein